MKTKLLREIHSVLENFPIYWEYDRLIKQKVIDDLRHYNKNLIESLLSNQVIKDTYSIQLGSNTIFKIEDFIDMLRYKNYWENSYTKYSNQIGLTSEGQYLKYNSDIVLDFPHKDCVLEGGMTKEEVGKKEIYYHNVLAKDEIDMLFSPKVLSNVKKYAQDGQHEVTEIKDTDNLIIKGNNLIALHTLKSRYAGKVKLIYIDPPYNTGNDSFKYNDRFNHSTWLTFMKNRLDVAKDLLSDDGSIWINIDDDEQAYLKTLCDEIFGRHNFINHIIWEKKYAPQNDATWFSDSHDFIMVYAKNKKIWRPNLLPRTEEMNSRYKNPDNDPRGRWQSDNLAVKTYHPNTDYTIITPSGRKVNPPKGYCWRVTKDKLDEMIKDNRIWFGEDGNNVPRIKRFLTEVKDGITATTIWNYKDVGHNQEARRELNHLSDIEFFSTPKPEKLLQRIIHLGSNENDIVLDFFMGSATTQAVAHKMNRQYIGVEQMDYMNTVSVPRLQKVIQGEQGGISKDVNWEGGGTFIYAELHDLNNEYVEDIQQVEDENQIESLIKKIKETAYLNVKVQVEKLTDENEEFNSLSLQEKKDILIQSLDMNQLYLSYSEIDDSQYVIDEKTKQFNHSFYRKDVNNDE